MHSSVVSQRYTPEDLLAMPMAIASTWSMVIWWRETWGRSRVGSLSRSITVCVMPRPRSTVWYLDQIVAIKSSRTIPTVCGFLTGPSSAAGACPKLTLPRGHIRVVPDLVLRVVSPNDLAWEVDVKVTEYLQVGTPGLGALSRYAYRKRLPCRWECSPPRRG